MPLTHMNRPAQESDELIRLQNQIATLTAGKANKTQANWIYPTLLNGWTQMGAETVRYRKDEFGVVRVEGSVGSGALGTAIFNFPVGYRKLKVSAYSTPADGALQYSNKLRLQPNGDLEITVKPGTEVYLSGITFVSEQ